MAVLRVGLSPKKRRLVCRAGHARLPACLPALLVLINSRRVDWSRRVCVRTIVLYLYYTCVFFFYLLHMWRRLSSWHLSPTDIIYCCTYLHGIFSWHTSIIPRMDPWYDRYPSGIISIYPFGIFSPASQDPRGARGSGRSIRGERFAANGAPGREADVCHAQVSKQV